MTNHPNPARDDDVGEVKSTAAQISAAYDAYERACGNRWERIAQAVDAALAAAPAAIHDEDAFMARVPLQRADATCPHAFVQRVHWCCEHCGAEMRSDAP